MKRNKDKRIKGRFITSVLLKYMFFSIVLIALLLALFFTITWKAGRFHSVPHLKELSEVFAQTDPNSYDSIDVERYLGRRGYVQILDENNNVIYSNSQEHGQDTYTNYEISFISDYDDFSLITVDQYKQPDGRVEQVVTTDSFTEDGGIVRSDVYVVDEDLNILYTTADKNKKTLTRREYELLTDRLSKKTTISKTAFTDSEGRERTILAFSPRNFKNTIERIKRSYLILAVEFLAAYALIAFLFSAWVAWRVKKPLKALNHAMEEVSSGNRGVLVDYCGPKEFVEICENFNDMSVALEKMEEDNLQLQNDKQKLIADISHDLKTPITVIKGYSKAITDGLVSEDEQKRYLETIYQRSEELTELIEEFHEYAKMDHPDNFFETQPTDLCEFARGYFAEKYNEFDIGGYCLEIDIDEKRVMVNLDGKRFRRVLDNIVGNFFKYCEKGSTFYCRVAEEAGKAVLVLADNGGGIPPAIRTTLFEPFVVGEKSRNTNTSGSGLGLALVKKIVEQHGGTVCLRSESGSLIDDTGEKKLNTQFVITLDVMKTQ